MSGKVPLPGKGGNTDEIEKGRKHGQFVRKDDMFHHRYTELEGLMDQKKVHITDTWKCMILVQLKLRIKRPFAL